MSRLESIIAHGNRGHYNSSDSYIECADGFTVSVIAGGGTYCSPRPVFCSCFWDTEGRFKDHLTPFEGEVNHDYPGPYHAVEIGFPSVRPEPWDDWFTYGETSKNPTGSVYGYVPVDLVRALIASHGGEVLGADV